MTTKNQIQGRKETKPVYISVPKLERLLEIVSTYSEPFFSSSYFQRYGFGNSDATLAVSSLRFLGVIDEEGVPTELMAKISYRDEEKKKAGFEEVVRGAYRNLFQLEKSYELSPEKLFDEIRGQYGVTPRIARTAVPAFLKLCEYAGLKEKTKTLSRERKKARTITLKTSPKREEKEINQHPGMKIIPVEKDKSAIGIPEGYIERAALDPTFRQPLDDFIKAARDFANSIKNEPPLSEETSEEKS